MVVLHPDSPLRCTECGNKQLTVTFSKNPQSSTFERWFVLVSAIPRRTSRVYIYILSSAPEKPNTRPGGSGSEFGRRTSLRETTLSSHRTTPQAPRSRRPLRRRRAHDCHARPLSATKSRRLRAPVSSAQAIADVVPVDHVPPTQSSQARRKRPYLCPAPLLGFSHSMCPPMTRTSLSLLAPPSNLRPLIKVPRSLALLRGSSHRHLMLATLALHPHRHRLLPSRCQLKRPPNLVSLRKWVPRGRKNSMRLPRLQ